jgi:hypothetical protein
MFDDVLAASVRELVSDCVVLSATAVAAPAFVAAVAGQMPTPLRLFSRSLFVTERDHTRPSATSEGAGSGVVAGGHAKGFGT